METNTTSDTTFEVGDRVQINDPWSFITGLGTVTKVEPWALGSTAVTVQLDDDRGTTRTYPCYLAAVETATWCCNRNGYADDSMGCTTPSSSISSTAAPRGHIHFDVEYDPHSGGVLTSSAVQAELRAAAESSVQVPA